MFIVNNPAVMEQKHVMMLHLLHPKLCGTKYKCEGLKSTWYVRSSTLNHHFRWTDQICCLGNLINTGAEFQGLRTQNEGKIKSSLSRLELIVIICIISFCICRLVFVYLSLSLLVASVLLKLLQLDQCKFIQEQRNNNNNNIEIHHPYAQEGSCYKQPCSSARKWS